MRSGVCGHLGSGGKAFSVSALAIPTRSAPKARARALTATESIRPPDANGDSPTSPPAPLHRRDALDPDVPGGPVGVVDRPFIESDSEGQCRQQKYHVDYHASPQVQ